ncbi:MAG: DMT family transporter [Rhodobacter sp.]|nr:DMT family transporter [Rhodobacter sp.]
MSSLETPAGAATRRANLLGALCALGATLCFSVNDVAIKFLSGDYALHQIVLTRAAIGIWFTLLVIIPLSGGWRLLRTKRLGMHMLRGCFIVVANMSFFLGLAVMPLADAVAVFFVAPLVITVFSVIFLKETVGPRRWLAVAVGMAGVVVMLRPGAGSFQWAALLPLGAAVSYAGLHMMTRRIGTTESAATMSVYIQIMFIMVSGGIGLAVGDGRFDTGAGVLSFLLRAWVWPEPQDWWLLALIGLMTATGGYLISQAYRISEAAFAAPFEYAAMPLAVLWGVMIFGEWPDAVAWTGILLIVGAGLFLLWREAVQGREAGARYRR